MKCELCKGDMKVQNSKKDLISNTIDRARKCVSCGHIERTIEISKTNYDKLIHENGTLKRGIKSLKANMN